MNTFRSRVSGILDYVKSHGLPIQQMQRDVALVLLALMGADVEAAVSLLHSLRTPPSTDETSQ